MADNRITIQAEFGQNYKDLGFIGRVGENDSREIVFDCADALTQFPGASIVCVIKRACDTKPYSAVLAENKSSRILPLSAVENAVAGQIMIELRAVSNDTILKSAMFSGRIAESLQGEGDRPGNPASDMLNRIDSTLQSAAETQKKLLSALDGVDTAVDGANTAAENAQAVADTVQAKLDNGDFVGPAGKNGEQGPKGDTGATGPQGAPGSDASVTAENIQAALGYTPVKDVQVAGSSVLDGGVAKVPIAQEDAPGVVSILSPQDSGIWNDNGSLRISYATDAEISSRLGNRKTIVCANMDYAVRAAMCDGNGAAWTENEQKAARERIGAVGLDDGSTSANLYDSSLQTEKTIAPHYYVNGAPYATTQYDAMWNCTAPISVSPSTMYTLGIVPAYHYVYANEDIMIVKPWSHAGSGVHFYDANGAWIKSTSLNTFTTPENCTSIRFNYIKGKKIDLAMLAERCMLVKGDTLPPIYEAYGIHDTTGIVSVLGKNGVPHYEYRNDILTVYQNGTKIVYGYSGNNNIMMCKGYGLEDAFIPFTTDILSPMIITASENADGDLDDSYRLTGGNHSYGQTSGTPSANTVLVEVFADGKAAKTSGLFNTLILHARHEIQAWNTEKADGTGRSVIVEDDYIIWDGQRMNVEIHLTPTEKVAISEYYGLQLAEINSCNVYGNKVKKNIATGGYSDEIPYYIEGICEKFKIRMHLDDVGLGKYTYNTTAVKYSKNNYKKAYFRPIGESHAFTAEDCLWLRGYFEIVAH